MSSRNPGRQPIPAATVVWALCLLLLPPMACSGTASTGTEEIVEAAQGDLIARLPADVTTVGYVDFSALRQSPLYEFAKREGAAFADPEELEDLIAQTGIDPLTDLHRLAFVSRGAVVHTDPSSSAILIVATFDRDRIQEMLADQATQEYEGYQLYTLASWKRTEEGEEESEAKANHGLMAILDDSTLAFGGDEAIRAIIDVAQGGASARSNQRLMGLLEDVDPGSQIWVVAAQDALFSEMQAPEGTPMPQIPIDRINAMILSIKLTDGMAFKLRGRTEHEEDAKLLGDSLNGMLAFGKMMLQSNSPDIFEILDRGVNAGSSGRDVTVQADLSMADIEALRDYAKATIQSKEQEG